MLKLFVAHIQVHSNWEHARLAGLTSLSLLVREPQQLLPHFRGLLLDGKRRTPSDLMLSDYVVYSVLYVIIQCTITSHPLCFVCV